MKLFIHVNSFEKSSVKLWPFCPGRDELKHVLLYLFEYFCFVQCFLHPRSAGMLKLGQRVVAFATRPWQRRRGSVALTGRRGTAKLQPGIRLQSARWTIVPGPGQQCWVLNWFYLVSWDPFLTHQRCGPCCGTLVCDCNGDIDDFYIF